MFHLEPTPISLKVISLFSKKLLDWMALNLVWILYSLRRICQADFF